MITLKTKLREAKQALAEYKEGSEEFDRKALEILREWVYARYTPNFWEALNIYNNNKNKLKEGRLSTDDLHWMILARREFNFT